ncbi:hypothetical protein E2C01_063241 [Portunus trituberculatus]|uniref:Secreted protein n=1 Tax=Portunus trituberculatus TaxID=210409 RepID=A0A5B7HJR5_PORTR|nr:hypothetical protein [Portunus trituberculatus]
MQRLASILRCVFCIFAAFMSSSTRRRLQIEGITTCILWLQPPDVHSVVSQGCGQMLRVSCYLRAARVTGTLISGGFTPSPPRGTEEAVKTRSTAGISRLEVLRHGTVASTRDLEISKAVATLSLLPNTALPYLVTGAVLGRGSRGVSVPQEEHEPLRELPTDLTWRCKGENPTFQHVAATRACGGGRCIVFLP